MRAARLGEVTYCSSSLLGSSVYGKGLEGVRGGRGGTNGSLREVVVLGDELVSMNWCGEWD